MTIRIAWVRNHSFCDWEKRILLFFSLLVILSPQPPTTIWSFLFWTGEPKIVTLWRNISFLPSLFCGFKYVHKINVWWIILLLGVGGNSITWRLGLDSNPRFKVKSRKTSGIFSSCYLIFLHMLKFFIKKKFKIEVGEQFGSRVCRTLSSSPAVW